MCARCEELEDRIAWLESELGLQTETGVIDAIRLAVKASMGFRTNGALSPARVILELYRAKGRPVSKLQILDSLPPRAGGEDERNTNLVNVWVCCARKALGYDAIQTVWGLGFRLSAQGMDRVAEIISPSLDIAA